MELESVKDVHILNKECVYNNFLKIHFLKKNNNKRRREYSNKMEQNCHNRMCGRDEGTENLKRFLPDPFCLMENSVCITISVDYHPHVCIL